ncbi:MAG TPA: outer membrane beta-barrel protein [Cryomorphaceae bacterium]|nr:outer membrane beta-barrel protein [Cryomorphaceae bacterium]
MMKLRDLFKAAIISGLPVIFIFAESKAQNFGIGISPEISTRNLVKTDFVPGIDEFIDESNELNDPIIGYTAQAFFIKPFSRKMFFETGLSISRDGYNSLLKNLSNESLLAMGLVNSEDPGFESTEEIETQNRFTSVGIPLRLAFVSSGKKWRFTWAFGVTPEYLLEATSTRVYRFDSGLEESFDNDFDTKPADFNLTASVSAGVEWAIERRSAIRIEPIIRYAAFPTFDRDAYEVNLFSYGLSLKYLFDLDLQY